MVVAAETRLKLQRVIVVTKSARQTKKDLVLLISFSLGFYKDLPQK